MSSSIDQRAVEMRFDNKQFESGIKTSVDSLGNLKKGLNLDGSAKSLSNLGAAAKSFSLVGLISGVDTISSRFTTLGLVGVEAIRRIANAAITYGKSIVSALTVTPISMGFSEYELKMGSIQTIMAGTGESLQTVNKYLNDLNTYSDKTIYSFADMTSNIGKFTNAGVSLKDSVAAIQGIANVAALSGANAGEASRAMYNFAQAISSGYVKLMDWKSIELANMATKDFKQQLIDSAVSAGTLTKQADGMYKTIGKNGKVISATKGFNDSLQEQWMTTDVLNKTLQRYSDTTTDIGKRATAAAQDVKTVSMLYDTLKEAAQSGWAQTWEIMIGDFEEAKTILTQINDVVGAFIGKSADARNALLSGWKDLGGRTALIDAFKNAFKGLSSVITPIKQAFKEIFPPTTAKQLYNITIAIRDFTKHLTLSKLNSDNLKRTFKGLFAILDIGKQAIFAIAGGIKDFLVAILPASGVLLSFTGGIGDWLVALNEAIRSSGIFNVAVDKVRDVLIKVVDIIKTAITSIGGLSNSFSGFDFSGFDKLKDRFGPLFVETDILKKVLTTIIGFLQKVAPTLIKIASKVGSAIGNFIGTIATALSSGDFSSLHDFLNTGILAGIFLGLKKIVSTISSMKIGVGGGFLSNITGILNGVRGSLESYQKSLQSKTLIRIAIAIGILAASILILSLIDSKKLTVALGALTALFANLFAAMAGFTLITKGTGFLAMGKIAIGLMAMAVSILLLSVAMKILSTIDWAGITKGLVSIGAMMAMLVVASKIMSTTSGGMIKSAAGLILFAIAIGILAVALKIIASMDVAELAKGLITLALLMVELILFMKVADFGGMGLKQAAGLLMMAISLSTMAGALKKIGELDPEVILKGLIGIGMLLAELTLFNIAAGGSSGIAKTATGLSILAGALVILAFALQKMGNMSVEEIAKGLITMGGALTILVVAMKFMTGGLAGAAALLIISVALGILAIVLRKFADMSISDIAKSLLTLIATLAIFAVAGLVIAPLTPVLLALGAAILLFGIAVLAAGAGLMLFSMALSALAISGAAGAAALTTIVMSLAALIPYIMTQIGLGLIAIAKVIIAGAPIIIKAIVTVLEGLLDALVKVIPKVGVLINTLVSTILRILVTNIPKMVIAGMQIVIGILTGIANNIGKVITKGADIIVAFLNGIAKELPRVTQAGTNLVISFINSLANALRNNTPALNAAMRNLITAAIAAATGMAGLFVGVGASLIKGMIRGIGNMVGALGRSAANAAKSAYNSAKRALGINSPSRLFAELGVGTGEGMIAGINKMAGKVANSAADMAKGTVDAMAGGLTGIADALKTDVELNPTIRPIVDMTDVQNGIDSTFNKAKIIDVSASQSKAAYVATSAQAKANDAGVGSSVTDNSNNPTISIENHYSVRNDNDIRKISQDLKTTLDRYTLAKGVPAT